VLVLAIGWFLLVPGADWLARHDVGPAHASLLPTARDAARGRLLTLGAGLLAAGALLFTARNFILSREGQVTDRYTKAIEQLGSDKLDVRIGGIYALERVARDSAKDHPTVMEVLTAFIREHSREQWPPSRGRRISNAGSPEQERLTRPDVQAAITVVGRRRRDAKRDILPINLFGAHLTRAHLTGAHLTGARLTGADLTRAELTEAHLGGARLTRADLRGADLTYADLRSARLAGADLAGADLSGADLSGANLANATWPEGVQVPEGWMVDSDSSRLKRSGQLPEVTASYLR
jgi:Pentapeptide repeats (8 copies)